MNWQKAAVDDLRNYNGKVASLENIKLRMAALTAEQQSIKAGWSDSTPVQGGGNKIEDRMLNNMVKRERLKYTYKATRIQVELVERGLAALDDRERLVLTRMFIDGSRGAVGRLADELHIEQSQVYRIKDRALYSFTIHMYGLVDY